MKKEIIQCDRCSMEISAYGYELKLKNTVWLDRKYEMDLCISCNNTLMTILKEHGFDLEKTVNKKRIHPKFRPLSREYRIKGTI